MKTLTTCYFLLLVLLSTHALMAQPANDDCSTAQPITIASSAANCNPISGTTLGATFSSTPTWACSNGDWAADDVWYTFTLESTLPQKGIILQLNLNDMEGDVTAAGMSVYNSCAADAWPIACFSDCSQGYGQIFLYPCNLSEDSTYYVRIWSGCSANDGSGAFSLCAYEAERYPYTQGDDIVLWGDEPGEGDFDCGLNDWTTTGTPDCARWQWEPAGRAYPSLWAIPVSQIVSPTASNGAAVFNSDYYDSGANTAGAGSCPGTQLSHLVSPSIDLSAYSGEVSLTFYQSYWNYETMVTVSYSTDGGSNWSPDIALNTNIGQNVFTPYDDRVVVSLPGVGGHDDVKIRFTWNGWYYYWIIDDVQLIASPLHNVAIANDFYAVAPNYRTPISQIEPFGFLADVANIGAAEQTNVDLSVTILDENQLSVYDDVLSYGTLRPDSVAENQPFAGLYTPDPLSGSLFTGVYTVEADSVDVLPDNNSVQFQFELTENVFSKDVDFPQTFTSTTPNYGIATFYHIVNGGPDYTADTAFFAVSNPDQLVGRVVNVFLYKLVDSELDGNNVITEQERQLVALNAHTFSEADQPYTLIGVPLLDAETFSTRYALESNTTYMLALEYATVDDTYFWVAGSIGEIDYDAQVLLSQVLYPDDPTRHRPAVATTNDPSGSGDYNTFGFGRDWIPALRFKIGLPTDATRERQLPEQALQLFPNPVRDALHLTVHLDQTADLVTFVVYDAAGRLISMDRHRQVQQQQWTYSVSGLAAGVYSLQLRSDQGVASRKFTVVR